MKRFLIAGLVAALFCGFAVIAGADAMMSSSNAAPNSFQASLNNPNAWIGKPTTDLLLNLGTPTYTVPNGNGETLAYDRHMGMGPETFVDVEQQFDIGSNGQITAVRTSQH
jgi:hypothetical protein